MAHEPDLALFKTAPGSLAHRQILADFFQSITEQQIPPERPSKVTIVAVYSCHLDQLGKLVPN